MAPEILPEPVQDTPRSTQRRYPASVRPQTISGPERWLTYLLRFGGSVLLLAFPTMLLPVSWMEATHRWLGLGEHPGGTIVDYLSRSIAALYGFHGVLMLLVSTDLRRHAPIVTFIGWMNILFGGSMILIDLNAGMPWYWTLNEGPPILLIGVAILTLLRQMAKLGQIP